MNQEERKQYKVLISKVKALYSIVHDSVTDTTTSEIGRYSSCKNMAIRYNQLASEAEMLTGHKIETFNINVIKDPGDMLWTTQKTIMEEVAVSAQFLIAQLSSEEEFAEDEICNLENFILSRLRAVVFTKPEKEKQVQDAVEALFIGNGWQKGIDYNRESGKIEFSGKEYIPDFIIPKLNLCIEIKLVREGRKSQIIEEICADIVAYSKEYTHQLFVVYDLGVIQNEVEFRKDISSQDGVKIIVVKH